MTSAFLFTTWSMKPGSWCEKPLWSCRQTCEREQVVERRDRPPPRDVARHLQPLRVLVEHRVDDVDERLVAVEEAVAAGEQVALEPALAEVLARAPPSPARPARGRRRVGSDLRLPGPVRDLEDGGEPVRGGLVGAEEAEGLAGCARSRRGGTRRARASPRSRSRAGRRARRRRSRGSRAAEVAQQRARRSRAGSRSSAGRPSARSAASSGTSRPVVVEQLLRPVAPHPLLEQRAGAPGSRARRRAAPGASARCPRPAARRPPSGRSSPSACAARSSATAAARSPSSRPPAGCAAISSSAVVERGREPPVHLLRVVAGSTRIGAVQP